MSSQGWNRWPVVVILLAALIGAGVLDRDRSNVIESGTVEPLELQPLSVGDRALRSTWYCAGGSGIPGGPADHILTITNPSDRGVDAVVAGFGDDGQSAQVELTVGAGSTQRVRVGDIVESEWVAALVESGSGDLVVHHEVSGAQGRAASPCASAPSRTWFGAAGSTSRDSRYLLALFNPFPDRATVDISFQTDEGIRSPTELERLVVAGQSVEIIEVDQIVTRRDQLSTIVEVRAGRVVVDRIQVRTGELGRTGLSMAMAAPSASETWLFPGGLVSAAQQELLTIYNPGPNRVELDVDILVDDPAFGAVAPLELTVPAGHFETVDIGDELARAAIELPVGHSTTVRSVNGQGVVVDRVLFGAEEGLTLGVPLAASELIVPMLGSPVDAGETTPEAILTTTTTASTTASTTTTTAPTTTSADGTTTTLSGTTTTVPTTTTTASEGATADGTTSTVAPTTTTIPTLTTTTVLPEVALRSAGAPRELFVSNPGREPASVSVVGWVDGSSTVLVDAASLGPASHQRFPINDLGPGVFLVITADSPVVAEWMVRTAGELVAVSAVGTLSSVSSGPT